MVSANSDLRDHSVQEPPASRLTARDVAARLQVSTKTVYRLKAQGELGFVMVGGSLRLREDDLRALENRGRVTPPRYGGGAAATPSRLNLQFKVTRRGRGARVVRTGAGLLSFNGC